MAEEEHSMEAMRAKFDRMIADMETRFDRLCKDSDEKVSRMHQENVLRLASIDHISRNNAEDLQGIGVQLAEQNVKLNLLFGTEAKEGQVAELAHKVSGLSGSIKYGSGAVAASVVLVGWYLSHLHKV